MNHESDHPAAPPCADLQAIAARAYAIWQERGCPEGRDLDHWIEAEAHFRRCAEEQQSQSDKSAGRKE